MLQLRHLSVLLVLLTLSSAAQDARRSLEKGDSLLLLDRPQRALPFFDEAIQLSPSADTYVARARAHFVMDHMDRFIMDVQQALRLDSTHAGANYQRAVYAMRSGDWVLADKHATTTLESTMDDALRNKALLLRGEARSERRMPDAAIEDLRAGITGGADDNESMALLARLLDATGQHDEALGLLVELCEREPGNIAHWTNRGYELARLGRHEEAMTMYARALDLDKDEPVALSDRALSLLALGREQEAWTDVERSLRYYPANPVALLTRAKLHLRKGDREKACKDLSLAKVLGNDPEVDRLHQEHCPKVDQRKR